MKNIQNKLVFLFIVAFAFPHIIYSQDNLTDELQFEVNKIHPFISITNEELKEAKTLIDLNTRYPSSWVKEYISVEIMTSHNGRSQTTLSKNDTLSQKQKDLMNMADVDTDIVVRIQYIPDNNLTHNDIKKMDFTFSVSPESDAKYIGGQAQLNEYLMENAIEKIPDGSFIDYDLAAIKFTIDEDGQIINAHVFDSVFQPYQNENVNKLLLETVQHMPCWVPAKYANGAKVKQEFVLTVGNMKSCVINL